MKDKQTIRTILEEEREESIASASVEEGGSAGPRRYAWMGLRGVPGESRLKERVYSEGSFMK